MKKVEQLPNAQGRKSDVAAGVESVVSPNGDLIKSANYNCAPPAVFPFPLEGEMPLSWNIELREKVNLHLEGPTLIAKKVRLLLSIHEQILCFRIINSECRETADEKNAR